MRKKPGTCFYVVSGLVKMFREPNIFVVALNHQNRLTNILNQMEFVYLNHCLYVQFNVPYSAEMKNTCQNGQKESEKNCTRSSILKKVQIVYKYVVTFNLDPKKEGKEILRSRYLPLQKCLRIGDMKKTENFEINVVLRHLWYNKNSVKCRWILVGKVKKKLLASLLFRSLLAVGGCVVCTHCRLPQGRTLCEDKDMERGWRQI